MLEPSDIHASACPWCSALVPNSEANRHGNWHRANDLHAPECEKFQSALGQHPTLGAYLTPRWCTCGLERAEVTAP